MASRKPKVMIDCVAERYSNNDERTIEFSFPEGEGGLINFRRLQDGTPVVDIYRIDQGVKVLVPYRVRHSMEVE